MKNSRVAAGALVAALSLAGTASSQVRSVVSANKPTASTPASDQNSSSRPNSTRARVLGQTPRTNPPASRNTAEKEALQAHAKPAVNRPSSPKPDRTLVVTSNNISSSAAGNRARTVSIEPSKTVAKNTTSSIPNTSAVAAPVPAAPSQIYRIGVRDVLDIQLPGQSGKQSTLFTVVEGGLLEYPLAGGPISAVGLTTQEVADLLRQRIKIFDNPAVVVNVRDYASHAVTISGLVGAPGVKNLRREAVPLYTLLAEALMLPEAARVTIARQGTAPIFLDLKETNAASTLVFPGDAIKVLSQPPGPTEFFFIGGDVSSPGQKPFHAGFTLTQAILASGGTTRSAGSRVRVSRQGSDGRLVTEEYNLKKIQDGKNPDPVLQKGDRILVGEVR